MLKRTVAIIALTAAMPAMAGDLSDAGLADPVVTPKGTRYAQPEECTIRVFGLRLPCNGSPGSRERRVARDEDGNSGPGVGGLGLPIVAPDLDGPEAPGDGGPEDGDNPEGGDLSSDPGESGGPDGEDGTPGNDDPNTGGPGEEPGEDDPETDGPGDDGPGDDGPGDDGPGDDGPGDDGPGDDGPGDDPETDEPETDRPRGVGNKRDRLEELGLNRDWQDNPDDIVDAIRDHASTGEPWSDFNP